MVTQYIVFPNSVTAINASSADWAQRVLKHPTISTAVTKQLWQVISNVGGTIGVVTDNSQPFLAASSILVDSTNPTVAATLAAIPNNLPG